MSDTTSETAVEITEDIREVKIHGIAHGGAGVGRIVDDPEGPVWFVDGALPEERVLARVRKRAKRHVEAELERVVEASPHRVTPPCRFAVASEGERPACGGCRWQHVAMPAQGELKLDVARGQLRRLPLEVRKVVESPKHTGYRRRARLHYERSGDALRLGFFGVRSHELVDVTECAVLDPALDRAFQRLRELAEHLPERGEVTGLSDGTHVVLGLPGVRPSDEVSAAIEAMLDETLVGVTIRGGRQRKTVGLAALAIDAVDEAPRLPPLVAGPFVFTQAQAAQNEALVRHVAKAAKASGRKVLELFAGAGNFTRALAAEAEGVWASDDDREAINRLRELADGTGLPIRARKDSAKAVLGRLARDGRTFDVVVLDPPRTGLGKEVAELVGKVAAKRVVYVSCDPATLARDLQVLFDDGFESVDVRVFDLMPMTPEVEIVATLKRTRPRGHDLPPHARNR